MNQLTTAVKAFPNEIAIRYVHMISDFIFTGPCVYENSRWVGETRVSPTVKMTKAHTCQMMFGLAPPSIHFWITATTKKEAAVTKRPAPIFRSGVSGTTFSTSG